MKNQKSNIIDNILKRDYLVTNLPKEVKDLFNANYKPLKKIIKEDKRKWEGLLCL